MTAILPIEEPLVEEETFALPERMCIVPETKISVQLSESTRDFIRSINYVQDRIYDHNRKGQYQLRYEEICGLCILLNRRMTRFIKTGGSTEKWSVNQISQWASKLQKEKNPSIPQKDARILEFIEIFSKFLADILVDL